MSKLDKLLEKLLSRASDANFAFEDVRYILLRCGFEEDVKGGHHIFTRDGVLEQANLQRVRGSDDAKPYQVRQVRNLVLKYHLGGETHDDKI
ncbi:MAG TPA: type II toxin-antitoxin system HicA family toxin [Longimicrobiaceae bacterium]